MNDETTTEIEIPNLKNNIVRVNFTERRKLPRVPGAPFVRGSSIPAPRRDLAELPPEWTTPWWVRLGALIAILLLSLFVL